MSFALRVTAGVALLVLPWAVWVAWRCWAAPCAPASRDWTTAAWEAPAAVALDLLSVLLLALVMPLERATWVSRAAWAVAGAGVAAVRLRRRRALAGPRPAGGDLAPARAPRWTIAGPMAAAVALTIALSAFGSWRYAIWDRQWHIPLVSSLRGQAIPFVNVYQPGVRLGYHVTGDVLAAMLQSLSFATLHASAALSLAHDLVFAAIGLAVGALVAGLLRHRGRFDRGLLALAPLGVVLGGPLTFGHGVEVPRILHGYAVLNNYSMSYRPHVVLAVLFIVGVGALCVRAIGDRGAEGRGAPGGAPPAAPSGRPRWRWMWPALPILAALAITDEPSAALLMVPVALALALAVRPPARLRAWLPALAAFAAAAAAVGAAMSLLPSVLSGGATRPPLELGGPHVPSLIAPPVPLFTGRGALTLLADIAPLVGAGAVLAAIAWRRRDGQARALALLLAAAVVPGIVMLTTVVPAKSPGEAHRFATLPFVLGPTLALAGAALLRGRGRWALVVPLAAGAACSAGWVIASAAWAWQFTGDYYAPGLGLPGIDCRRATGAEALEPLRATYLTTPSFYAWAGCHPIMAPGHRPPDGPLDVGRPIAGGQALNVLRASFTATGRPVIACLTPAAIAGAAGQSGDAVCDEARSRLACRPSGELFVLCAEAP